MKLKKNPEKTDADNPEWTDADFKRAVPFSALPETLREKLTNLRRGRPLAKSTKERITIRLSPEVVAAFRASGPGWQTRLDAILVDWLRHHSPNEVTD